MLSRDWFQTVGLCRGRRALQTRELRSLVDAASFKGLTARIKQNQTSHDADLSAFAATGLQIRLCPECSAPIEQAGGCDSMVRADKTHCNACLALPCRGIYLSAPRSQDCWRCGHKFSWSSARKITDKPPPPHLGQPGTYRCIWPSGIALRTEPNQVQLSPRAALHPHPSTLTPSRLPRHRSAHAARLTAKSSKSRRW